MEFIADYANQINEECSTFILPALSVGNVGQLAVDLLIASTKAARIGYLDDPNVIPCVGNDAYSPIPSGELALPLEVYESSNNLAFVQQRSPFIKGKIVESAKNMAQFASAAGKKHVLVLSSLDFRLWNETDTLSGTQVYYLSSANQDRTDDACEELGWKILPGYYSGQRLWKYLSCWADDTATKEEDFPFEDDFEDEDYYASLPFAALFCCLKAKGLKVTCLLSYCSEGDNIPDAFRLASSTYKILGPNYGNAHGSGWVIPLSWGNFYGPPPAPSLF